MIVVPAIVLAVLFFLNEKAGRPLDFADTFASLRGGSQFVLQGFQPEDVLDFGIDWTVPEMHDRTVVGTARRLGAACISRDVAIAGRANVVSMW